MKKIIIGNYEVAENKPCFFIAEAGINHNNNLKIAKKLIDVAAEAGADAVKFQTFKSENVMTKHTTMAPYQIKNLGKEESQLEMAKKLEMPYKNFEILKEYCDKKGIIFLSTPHSPDAIDFLDSLIPAYKIGSGDLTNLPFLKQVAKKTKPIILATGMATLEEVVEAVKIIKESGNDKIIVLHCTTSYPCDLKDVNLAAMKSIKDACNVLVGYSDHTIGIDVVKLANKHKAVVIEKHFTLDNNLPGPDHKASLNPNQLKQAVHAVRTNNFEIETDEELILGLPEKKPTSNEKKIADLVRKSIVAEVKIPKGIVITKDMLAIKRPGTGIKPKYIENIIGKKAKREIKADSIISKEDLI